MQVIGFDPGVSSLTYHPRTGTAGDQTDPVLIVTNESEVDEIPLMQGQHLAYSLQYRHCAGALRDSTHIPCDSPIVPYCDRHTDRWPCARCTGECDLPLASCREEHAVYLAAFAPDHFKVGVTRLARLVTRLKEQGADKAAHIRTVSDGRIARTIEREIADTIPDRTPIDVKLDGLHQTVDPDRWDALLAAFTVLDTFDFSYGLDLDRRPVAETLATGTVKGTKGRLLVLEHAHDTYTVDIRDLIGYELESGATNRELQSSFGAFR